MGGGGCDDEIRQNREEKVKVAAVEASGDAALRKSKVIR